MTKRFPFSILIAVMPVAMVYAFGLGLAWVMDGFRVKAK
jgi:hypothetical protein